MEKTGSSAFRAWKRTGERALEMPIPVTVPYLEKGIMINDSADATAYSFMVAAGQKVTIILTPDSTSRSTVFTDLWELQADNTKKLQASADTLSNAIEQSSASAAQYIVRFQPALNITGRYTFKILLSPMLGFPIAANVKANIGSVWGDDRDAGIRKHEGIDIFAKKGSYAVAVSDGTVDRVSEGGIGGKVVWFSPDHERFSVYYAHLDTQLVQPGQRVKQGDIMGTVGNTGNARYTPAHLHFGIYTNSGAINPLYFVQAVKAPANIFPTKLNQLYAVNSAVQLYASPDKQHPYATRKTGTMRTVSFSNNYYKVLLNDGSKAFVRQQGLPQN